MSGVPKYVEMVSKRRSAVPEHVSLLLRDVAALLVTYDQLKFQCRLKLLGDTAAVNSVLDRLLHHGHVLKCGPKSCRTKSSVRVAE